MNITLREFEKRMRDGYERDNISQKQRLEAARKRLDELDGLLYQYLLKDAPRPRRTQGKASVDSDDVYKTIDDYLNEL